MPLPLIVCFGDSLTAGFQSPTQSSPDFLETPYGEFLQRLLAGRARVLVSGVCGELTDEMSGRFERDALSHQPAWVVILGGTNDLGYNRPPAAILRNLTGMYERASARGVRIAAVTVPSIRGFDEFISPRHELNGLIAAACRDRHMPCVDLFAATAEPGVQRLAAAYSNDGLHLTTAGYELLAQMLYDQVFKSL